MSLYLPKCKRWDSNESTLTVTPLNQFVYASIPEETAEAFAFLRDIGEDDIIKNEVKVQFGKGQDEAGAFMDDCQKAGLDPEQKQRYTR